HTIIQHPTDLVLAVTTTPPPPSSTLFPYTTLFRSDASAAASEQPRGDQTIVATADHDDVEGVVGAHRARASNVALHVSRPGTCADRKSTRLNSSHSQISYAVFRLIKKVVISRCCPD